jgi:tRNA(Ile)-lysidine synthase
MRRYCREHRVEPRDDPTNELLLATRNRARHEVMPVLRGLNPRVDEALARLATAAADDAAVLRATAENALNAIAQVKEGYLSLDITGFQAIPPALRGRVLRIAVGRVLGSSDDLESVHVDALVRLAGLRSGRASLPHGLVAVRDSKLLTLCRGELPKARAIEEMRLIVPGTAEAGGWRFEAAYAGRPETVSPRGRLVAYLDADAVAGGMHIRSRRPGDRVRPLGLGGEKKLQDVFVDAKIPASERDGIPLLVVDWGIAWVPGLCIDERARVTERTERCVRVRARRPG